MRHDGEMGVVVHVTRYYCSSTVPLGAQQRYDAIYMHTALRRPWQW